MSSHQKAQNRFDTSEANIWFDEFIGQLKADQLALQKDVARPEKEQIYQDLIFGDGVEMAMMVRSTSTAQVVKYIVLNFIGNLQVRKADFTRLAFDLTNDKVLVWAEIDEDDISTEGNIVLAAAETNAKFYENTGICIESTIVENSDGLDVPRHYTELEIVTE